MASTISASPTDSRPSCTASGHAELTNGNIATAAAPIAKRTPLRTRWTKPSGTVRVALAARIFFRSAIIHLHQVKTIGGRERAAPRTVMRIERGFQILSAPFAFADKLQRSGHRPYLVMQEGARGRIDH